MGWIVKVGAKISAFIDQGQFDEATRLTSEIDDNELEEVLSFSVVNHGIGLNHSGSYNLLLKLMFSDDTAEILGGVCKRMQRTNSLYNFLGQIHSKTATELAYHAQSVFKNGYLDDSKDITSTLAVAVGMKLDVNFRSLANLLHGMEKKAFRREYTATLKHYFGYYNNALRLEYDCLLKDCLGVMCDELSRDSDLDQQFDSRNRLRPNKAKHLLNEVNRRSDRKYSGLPYKTNFLCSLVTKELLVNIANGDVMNMNLIINQAVDKVFNKGESARLGYVR
jgi:hypothetical protein